MKFDRLNDLCSASHRDYAYMYMKSVVTHFILNIFSNFEHPFSVTFWLNVLWRRLNELICFDFELLFGCHYHLTVYWRAMCPRVRSVISSNQLILFAQTETLVLCQAFTRSVIKWIQQRRCDQWKPPDQYPRWCDQWKPLDQHPRRCDQWKPPDEHLRRCDQWKPPDQHPRLFTTCQIYERSPGIFDAVSTIICRYSISPLI